MVLYYIIRVSWGFGIPLLLYKWKFPNWHQSPLGGPITLQIIPNGHKLLCGSGWGDVGKWLHLGMRGCGNMGVLESLGGIQCTKSAQNWTKSTSRAPSQPSCPQSMNGSTTTITRVHMWMVDWAGVILWVWMHQFSWLLVGDSMKMGNTFWPNLAMKT